MTEYLPFLAILAPFTLFWNQSKAILVKLFSLFWKKKNLDYVSSVAFYKYLSQYPCYSFDNYDISVDKGYDLEGKEKNVIFRKNFTDVFFYKNIIPIIVTNEDYGVLGLSYVNLTFPFKKLLLRIMQTEWAKPKKVQHSFHYIAVIRGKAGSPGNASSSGSAPSQTSSNTSKKSSQPVFYGLDQIGNKLGKFLDDTPVTNFKWSLDSKKSKYIYTKQGKHIYDISKKWADNEDWYFERGIRYYKGILLHSKPGNGKSALIYEIAKDLQLPLWIVDLSSLDNKEFCSELNDRKNNKGIILFEDIDCVYKGRENISNTELIKGLTFDCFINKLSGADAIKNKLVFCTTNDLSVLDPAMIRPGRFDDCIELLPLDKDERIEVAKRIVGKEFDNLIEDDTLVSTAKFEAACVQQALSKFWS